MYDYEELVKALRETRETVRENPNLAMHVPPYQLSAAADAIEKLSKPRWIPTKEPPREDGKYITLFANGAICDNYYMVFTNNNTHPEGGKWYHNEASMGGVTHWMPFPELPKEEE